MPKIQPIQREPASTSDREALAVLAVNATGGVRITGPAARVNGQQSAGTKVAGATALSGATGLPPSKTSGKVTKP
jgi:hypothetical protein